MGDDWQPGDLALCVRSSRSGVTHAGRVYTVTGYRRDGIPALFFQEVSDGGWREGYYGHTACRFRKIRPHTPDAEDAETIALLTGKPAQVPA